MTRQKKAALQKRLIRQAHVELFKTYCKATGPVKRAALFLLSLPFTSINYSLTADVEPRAEVQL